jgi:hypothetical protein
VTMTKPLIPSFEISEKSIHEVFEEARENGMLKCMEDFCRQPWKCEKELKEMEGFKSAKDTIGTEATQIEKRKKHFKIPDDMPICNRKILKKNYEFATTWDNVSCKSCLKIRQRLTDILLHASSSSKVYPECLNLRGKPLPKPKLNFQHPICTWVENSTTFSESLVIDGKEYGKISLAMDKRWIDEAKRYMVDQIEFLKIWEPIWI